MNIHSCEFFRVYIKKEGVKEGMLEFLPWIDFTDMLCVFIKKINQKWWKQ